MNGEEMIEGDRLPEMIILLLCVVFLLLVFSVDLGFFVFC